MGDDHNTRVVAVLDAFEARRVEVAKRMVIAMRAEIPEYQALLGPSGSASPQFQREVLEHALVHVDAYVRTARTGRPPAGRELDFVRARGEQRARELLPLDALQQAYLIGQRVFWEVLSEIAGDEPTGARVMTELTPGTFAYTQAIFTAVAETYTRVRQQSFAERDRARRDLLDVLLACGAAAGEVVNGGARRARNLGLDPEAAVSVVVAVPDVRSSETLRQVAEALSWHGTPDPAAAFVVVRHEEVVAVVPRPVEAVRDAVLRAASGVRRTHGIVLRAGIGLPCAGLDEVQRGHGEAYLALRHARGERVVVALSEVAVFDHLTASADATARRMVPEDVARLAGEAALVATLQAYAASDLNVAEAARALVVHPNTVHYRLGRVQSLSGVDPRRFEGLVELLTAIRILGAGGS